MHGTVVEILNGLKFSLGKVGAVLSSPVILWHCLRSFSPLTAISDG